MNIGKKKCICTFFEFVLVVHWNLKHKMQISNPFSIQNVLDYRGFVRMYKILDSARVFNVFPKQNPDHA